MGLLDIKFPREKEYLQICIDTFNMLCESGEYPKIMELTPFELAKKTANVPVSLWKEFLLDPQIAEWYATERYLLLKSQVHKLIRESGESRSTAAVQTLTTLLKQLNETEQQKSTATIVYNFIDLSEEERKNPNINVVSIPSGIRNAIQTIERRTTDEEKR